MYEEILTTWPVPLRRHLAPTRFGDTHVLDSGDPGRQLVLLLPGSFGTALQWAANVESLVGAGFRVVAVDLINDVGRSVASRPPQTADQLVDWFADLISALGGKPVHLVGMSYGGWVAAHAALRLPHLVRSLTLIDPVGLAPLPAAFLLRALPLLVMPTRRVTDHYLRWFLAPGAPLPVPFARLWELGWRHARPSIAATDPFTDSELAGIKTSTLILLGEHDPIYQRPRSLVRTLATRMPAARVKLIEGAGHLATIEQRAHVDELLRSFLANTAHGPVDSPTPAAPAAADAASLSTTSWSQR